VSDTEIPTSPQSKQFGGDDNQLAPSSIDPGWDEDFDPWATKKRPEEAAAVEAAAPSASKKLKTHVSKKEKKELSRLEGEEIARSEQRILDGEAAEPETADEFDR
jgi:hypothetical protein